MKPLRELREILDFHPEELSGRVSTFARENIDWDVYLPTKGRNLQREFVWTLYQKRELINSVLIGRHIPHCAILSIVNPENIHEPTYQIIDGKQRLSASLDFYANKFTIIVEDKEYYYKDLPEDYQNAIKYHHFRYYNVNEKWGEPMTDQQKITWFRFINYAGTPQDIEHLNGLD